MVHLLFKEDIFAVTNRKKMAALYYTTEVDPTFDETTRIIPTPQITLATDITYASENNNVIVGHKHIVTLTGSATAFRKESESDPGQPLVLSQVVDNISRLRSLLSQMGLTLYLRENNQDILKAIGGKLVSFELSESPNNWRTFANYTVTLEFQSVSYDSADDYTCAVTVLDSSTTQAAIDTSKHKISNYNENYNISISEDYYNRLRNLDSGEDVNIENILLNFTYSLEATGKHFFVDDELIPAWEQAKNFVQDKLKEKITQLFDNLGITSSTACGATETLTSMQSLDNDDALLKDLSTSNKYKIYNEEITCNASEAEGTFSVQYNCILKRSSDSDHTYGHSTHTFTKDVSYNKENSFITTITINGNIQGLIEGGLVNNSLGSFSLPNNGNFIIAASTGNVKYNNALNTLQLVVNLEQTDLIDTFKEKINVTYSGLGLDPSILGECLTELPAFPKASNFNLTHNPFDGTINYSADFNSNLVCGGEEYNNIVVSINNPVKVYATFDIPGASGTSNIGTVLQNIGTQTSKTINISIQGANKSLKKCGLQEQDINDLLTNSCVNFIMPSGIADKLPSEDMFILTTRNKTTNLVDGSYTINLGYICNSGCLPP